MQVLHAVGTTLIFSLHGAAGEGTAGHPSTWITSDLVGMEVVSPQGEMLGEIEDIIVRSGGRTSYAVLSFEDGQGLGDKLFALPWTELRTVEPDGTDAAKRDAAKKAGTRSLVLSLSKERLKSAPSFEEERWPKMAQADWASDVDAFYGTDASAKKAVEAGQRGDGGSWRLSELVGTDVSTPSGETLGDVENLAIDTNGRVSYAVLSVGGFLGMGDRHVAIPWDGFRFPLGGEKGDERQITLSTSKEKLEQAPQFCPDKEDRAEMCGNEWIEKVYEYHSVPTYWSTPAETAARSSAKN